MDCVSQVCNLEPRTAAAPLDRPGLSLWLQRRQTHACLVFKWGDIFELPGPKIEVAKSSYKARELYHLIPSISSRVFS